MHTNIAIIDDDPDFMGQFQSFFTKHLTISCIAACSSVDDFVEHLPSLESLSFLFLDIHLETTNAIFDVPRLKALLPHTEIIMLTVDESPTQLIESFKMGAVGYLLKKVKMEDLPEFIDIFHKGGAMMSSEVALALFERKDSRESILQGLTEKEWQMLELLAEGWGYKHIADKMHYSVDTIRFYMKRIYKTIGVNSKGEAINLFFKAQNSLVPPSLAQPRKRGRPPRSLG